MKKRLLSILLAAVMVLTMLPVTAMATASNDYTQWRQGDPEWNQAEAWPADEYPNASMRWMRNAGCLVTSVAMLLRHYGVVTTTDVNSFNPWICNNALKAAGAFTSGADMYWDGVRKAYPGFVYVGQKSYSKETLASLYSQGYACIVGVNGNGHYVAVKSANSSGATIMDPGWGYTSLSSFSSVNTIVYYSATPSAHTCDRGSYQYYEAAHPHYKNYKCSICGEIWRDTSEPTLLATCDDCRPGKPALLNMRDSYETGEAVTFAWAGTSNTTHYNLWLERSIGNDKWENVEQIFYADNGLTRTFEAGEYRAQLLSYNSDLWETDRSDWVHTWSDDCFFTVKEPAPTSGSCGENLTWYFDESTSTLRINGTGTMADYGEYYYQSGDAPWWKIKDLIEDVEIGNGVTSIGDNAFALCKNLQRISFSSTITSIGDYAFSGSGLGLIAIPYGITSIGQSAFSGCEYLYKVEISGSVAELPWNMLKDCPYLTDVVICNGVTTIGYDVFRGCGSLKSVTIPATVHSIGGHAFMDCEALTDIYYNGSASQWSAITVGTDNEPLTNATLHCAKSAPAAPVVKIGNSSTSGKPKLTWNAVSGATSYRVFRSESRGSGYSLLGTTTATSYTNTGAKAGTTYYYRVKAVNDAGLSPYSNIVSGQVKSVTPKPAAPVVKIGNSASSGKPMLTWNAVSGATSYKVYRATSQNGAYSLLGTVTATSYTNTGAKAGTTYYYKVKAVNSAGESAYSNIVSGRATVTTLTLGHSSTSGKPQLTWKAVSGAASYKVYRATAKNGAYSVINTTKALTYTNTGAALGTTYYYKVEALNAAGKSMGFSAIVEGKVAPVLAVGYSSVSGKPQLTWKAVPGATEYQVYRSTQQNSGYTKINTTTSTSYVNTGAKAGTTYYYKIVAVKGTAVSDFSNIVSARPGK